MRCPAHEQLLHQHLLCFHHMRCASTWEESLRHKLLAESAARAAADHQLTCPACSAHRHGHAISAPTWQAGLY